MKQALKTAKRIYDRTVDRSPLDDAGKKVAADVLGYYSKRKRKAHNGK